MRSFILICIAGLLALSSLPAGQAVSYGSLGTKVVPGSTDFIPTLTETLPAGVDAYVARRDIGTAADNTDDAYYIIFGTGAETAITSTGNTYRLTCGVVLSSGTCGTANAAEGRWVAPGDADVATPNLDGGAVLGTLESMARFLEVDGIPGWSLADGLFVDLAGGGSLTANDVRLLKPGSAGVTVFTCTTCPNNRIVAAGDTDLGEAGDGDRVHPITATYATGAFKVLWWDGDNTGTVTTADVFYIKGPSAATYSGTVTQHPDIGDVRIVQSATNALSTSLTFGGPLTVSSTSEVKPQFRIITPRIAITNTADPDLPDQNLFLHFSDPDGIDNHLTFGDYFLYRGPSGGSGGTQVTTEGTGATTPGTGTGIDTDAAFTGLLRYYDLSPTGYSANDPIYVKRPANVAGTVEIGDFRLSGTTGCTPTCTAGTVVKAGDSDIGSTLVTDADLVVKLYDADGSQYTVLRQVSSVLLADTLGATAGAWESATEPIYIGSGTAVASTVTRFYHPNAALSQLGTGGTGVIDCTNLVANPDCPTGATPAGTLSAYTNLRVTGPDATFDFAASEHAYDSVDDRLGPGDLRVTVHAVGGAIGSAVLATSADALATALTAGDILFVAHDVACGSCTSFMRVGDVFVVGSTFGTRVTASTTGFIPVLAQQTTGTLVRYNRNDAGSASDDTFYVSFAGALPLQINDIRLTGIGSIAGGTLIKTGDSTYVQEVAGGAQFTQDGALITDATNPDTLCYIDVDGRPGFSSNDPLYVDIDPAVFGGIFGAQGTLQSFDLRVTPYPATGTALHAAGTILLAGNSDLTSGQTTCAASTLNWFLRTFDANGNGRFDAVDATASNDDIAYFALGTTLANAPPPLNAVRITGTGGATGSTAGTTVTTTTSATATSSTLSATTSSSTSTTSSDTVDIAQVNQALQASLTVQRSGGNNVLTWTEQSGVAGFQVFGSSSPFVLLATLGSSSATYTDAGAPADRSYVVTAFLPGGELTADQVNAGTVPGYTAAPTGETPATTSQTQKPGGKDDPGFIPGPGLVPVVLALAALALVARRKL